MAAADRRSVTILGGGVIGMAIALELAGSSACTLVDPAPGRGASWAAAGMLSAAAEVAPGEEPLLADLEEAAVRWPGFADRVEALSGLDVGLEAVGSVLVGLTQSDVREVARLVGVISRSCPAPTYVDAVSLVRLEPALSGGIRGGWLLDGDHRVDNRRLVESLHAALKALGVTILEDRCVRISVDRASVRCSLEHQGDVTADCLVLATGAAPPPAGLEHLDLPSVRPVRGITLRCSAVPGVELPSRTVRGVVDGVPCYLVPRDRHALVVGATTEEQGDAELARAGGVHGLLDAARSLFPGLDELSLDEIAVGLRPATEDHLPYVGSLDHGRVVAALGHYRNGILLAPLAAARVAELVDAAT